VSKPAYWLPCCRLGERTDDIRRFHDAFISRLAEAQADTLFPMGKQ